MTTHGAADLLDSFGRDDLRELVLREVDTEEAGYSRRGHTGQYGTTRCLVGSRTVFSGLQVVHHCA